VFREALVRLAPTSRTPPLAREVLRAAVAEMRARGMTLRDIGTALGIHEAEVARLVTEPAVRTR
jgi:hypothetical protein